MNTKERITISLSLCLAFAFVLIALRFRNTVETKWQGEHNTESPEESMTSRQESHAPEHGTTKPEPVEECTEDAEPWEGPEQWITPLKEDTIGEDMLNIASKTWQSYRAEFELYALSKYADWTREQAFQRWREIDAPPWSEEHKLEERELDAFTTALNRERQRKSPPPIARDGRNYVRMATKESIEFDRIYKKMRDSRWESPLPDADREFMNAIITRLNQAARTNKALVTYWDYEKRRP